MALSPSDALWAVAIDVLLVATDRQIGLIYRPTEQQYALLGEKLLWNERADEAVRRALQEELGLFRVTPRQGILRCSIAGVRGLYDPQRDPRFLHGEGPQAQVLSVVYVVWVDRSRFMRALNLNRREVARLEWFAIEDLPPMWLDHREIITSIMKANHRFDGRFVLVL